MCVLLLQDLLQSCSRGGRRRVEDMCYERRRAEVCVDEGFPSYEPQTSIYHDMIDETPEYSTLIKS